MYIRYFIFIEMTIVEICVVDEVFCCNIILDFMILKWPIISNCTLEKFKLHRFFSVEEEFRAISNGESTVLNYM